MQLEVKRIQQRAKQNLRWLKQQFQRVGDCMFDGDEQHFRLCVETREKIARAIVRQYELAYPPTPDVGLYLLH